MLNGLFDIENRLDYLTENGDMLPHLKELCRGKSFAEILRSYMTMSARAMPGADHLMW